MVRFHDQSLHTSRRTNGHRRIQICVYPWRRDPDPFCSTQILLSEQSDIKCDWFIASCWSAVARLDENSAAISERYRNVATA